MARQTTEAGPAEGIAGVREAGVAPAAKAPARRVSGPAAPATAGHAALEDADALRVSTETARRMACDARSVVMRHAADGSVLDGGRKTRTVPPALRRALQARDHGCRFPGCNARLCDAHHVRHWADGGATRLDNLVLLCRRHHRAVHEEGFGVRVGRNGDAAFCWPDGRPFPDAPAAPRWSGPPLAPTGAHLAAADIEIGPDTATPDGTASGSTSATPSMSCGNRERTQAPPEPACRRKSWTAAHQGRPGVAVRRSRLALQPQRHHLTFFRAPCCSAKCSVLPYA